MENKELKQILLANFMPVPGVNFSSTEIKSATRNAIVDFFELKDLSPREIRARRPEIMALVEEVIDEVLPIKLEEKVSQFAEIKQFARDAEVVFDLKNRGKRRAWLTIKKGQRGGMYQAARLDDTQMSLNTWTETVGVFVTLEEILLGKYSLVDLMNNILDGFEERLYVQVIEALQTAANYAPSANVGAASGIDASELDPVIRIVSAYGAPMIFGFHSVVSKFTNSTLAIGTYSPNVPASDLEEIKQKGFVGVYKGTPIVMLPNYIIDENTNEDWMLDESYLFIIPTGVKPVKVALKGDLTIIPVEHPTGSREENAHKLIGVGMLLTNNIGLYEDQAV
jgi:hypothetical protein